jgi:hypothetical protein
MDRNICIGTASPDAFTRSTAGFETVLHCDTLMSLLNAAFHGADGGEVLVRDLERHRMEVLLFEMRGRETRVTLPALAAGHQLM